MSTSLLYHGFGLRGYTYVRTEYQPNCIVFHVRHQREHLRCPDCRSPDVIRRGTVEREFRSIPFGQKQVRLVLPVQRVECGHCGSIRQVRLGFAEERYSHTRAFERYALGLLRHMTMKDVARHLDVLWDTIKDIQTRHLQKHYGRPRLRNLSTIAIDEISIGAGHRYLTVVLDLSTGAVVFVGNGKGADALRPFWRRLKASAAKVKAVAIDMSPAYIKAIEENLPSAKIVFDRFHVMKLYNDKLSDLRRDLYHHLTTVGQQHLLKGTRWLLLKNEENLSRERTGKTRRRLSEYDRLQRALEINAPLAQAYYLKEELRCFWEQLKKSEARAFLDDWIARADASGTRMLKQFARTLAAHRSGLLAYYDYPISTAPLEGTNTKIRVMQRQAYGFRDIDFFKLKIFAIHRTKYALVGCVLPLLEMDNHRNPLHSKGIRMRRVVDEREREDAAAL